MTLKHIPLLVCAFAALTASAGAQFTAVVVPPPAKSRVDPTAKQDSVRRATVALAARVTDMRKWVDSAAGVSIPSGDSTSLASKSSDSTTTPKVAPQLKDSVVLSRNERIRADSAASIATVEVHDSTGLKDPDSAAAAVPPTSGPRTRADTRTFSGGAPAPATATMLPFLAIAGVTTLLAGLALRRH
jgi:hypothetical protein